MKKMLLLLLALFFMSAVSFSQATASLGKGNPLMKNESGLFSTALRQSTHQPLQKPTQKTIPVNEPGLPKSPNAWISTWYFCQSPGYYTPITGGTILGTTANDENVFNNLNIGFTFSYNGTNYTNFSVATNGFFAFGATVVTSSTPLSTGTSNNVVSALGIDLQGQTGSSLQYLTTGSSPNRKLTIQWAGYRKKSATGDNFNFQIILSESNNSIAFSYGAFTVNATNSTAQVGIRGASSSDFNNRLVNATYSTWDASGPGTANSSNCRLRSTVFPEEGQAYGWTPVQTATATIPLIENFDNIPTGTFPKGWILENTNGDVNIWQNGAVFYNSEPNGMFISYNSSMAMNDWFFSPKLTFQGGHSYKVSFFYSNTPYTTNYPEKLEVKYGTSATSAGMTSAAIFSNTNITSMAYTLGTGTFSPATNGDYYVGWHGFSAADMFYLFVDDISITEVFTHDVGSIALMNPTKIPSGLQLPWFGKVQNFGQNTETFPVDTRLRENGSLSTTSTNTVTSLTPDGTSTLSGFFNLSSLGASSSFDLAIETMLTGDQYTGNNLLTNYTRPCVKDSIYAWDDGVSEGTVGWNTGTGWLGQFYYLSAPDTLTSVTIKWGTIPGSLAGNSFEIYNVSGGVPTTKYADIITGINLTKEADSGQWKTYKATSPVVLPAGTYWIGAHQTTALSGTYLISDDQTGLNSVNYLSGFAFYSPDGNTWTDYASGGLTMFNMIRPNFATIFTPFVGNPSGFTASAASTSQIDLSWTLNGNGNNVLLAWSPTGTFGTPVNGTTYSPGATIPGGGTVLLYNNNTGFNHTGLSPSTVYYYKIWSYNGTIYSAGATTEEQTLCVATPAPWTEGFEGTIFPPVCWDSYSGSGVWTRTTLASGYGTGTASALAEFFAIEESDPFTLVTLSYTNGTLVNPRLSFDFAYAAYSEAEIDELDILYSTDEGATWNYLYVMLGGPFGELNTAGTTTSAFVPTSSQWKTKLLSLPAGTNKIAFMAYSAYGNNLYLDNIKTVESLAHDAGTESIDVPTLNTVIGSTLTPQATFYNYGTNTETFNVTMTIDGGYSSTKTVTALAPATSQQISFDSWTPSATGQYLVTVYSSLGTDMDYTNDTLSGYAGVYTGSWADGSDFPMKNYLGTGVGYVDHSGAEPVGYLFSIGGNTASGLGTECYKYNESTDTWSAIASLPAGRRVLASACVGNYIYAIGGTDMSSVYQNTVYKYDIAGNSWSTVASLPLAVGWGKAVAHGNYIYFAGGIDGTNYLSSVYVYDVIADSWSSATPMPAGRFGGGFSVVGDILVYVAGATSAGITNTVYVGTIDSGNPLSISWEVAKSNFPGNMMVVPNIMDIPLWSGVMPVGKAKTIPEGSKAANYPGGAMYRFDAAPWGTDGIIVAGGSPTSAWYPAVPGPCYMYKPVSDTWVQEPYMEKPVTGASMGSVNLSAGTSHTWKLIVAGGIDMLGNDTTYTQIFTDDVTEPLAHDVGVSTINANEVLNLGVTPTATVKNYGTNAETFDVTITIGAYSSTKTVTGLIPTLSQTVTFDPWSNTAGDYSIQVCTNLTGDLNTLNDCKTQSVKVMDLDKQVYGYIAYTTSTTDSIGPATFNLSTPDNLINLNPQGAELFVNGGTWANGMWYATVYNTAIPYNFITIDPVTGLRTVIGDMGISMNGLAYNVADGVMYGVNYTSPDSKLYTIDLATGIPTLINTIPGMLLINLAIDDLGNCFSVDAIADMLVKITLPGGTYTVVGPTGFSAYYAQDMEFDRNSGDLFIAAHDQTSGWLGWVNTATGDVLKINDFESGAEITGFAIPYTSAPPLKTLSLYSVFLEGLYAGSGTMNYANGDGFVPYWPDGSADHITVELHNSADYSTIEFTKLDVMLSTTGTATVEVDASFGGSYYLTIKHRNSLETTSALPVDFSGSTINYAFDAASKAYGNNMGIMTDATAVIYAGDANQDGIIDGSDLNNIGNLNDLFSTGYLPEDVNGDGLVDGTDLNITGNNNDMFVARQVP